ncbi:MAG: hypothetical protein PHQ43_06050 [Dehalococcoidales bacterium]|nr:hypothetical protein [Dehalococcoidales bacterium]
MGSKENIGFSEIVITDASTNRKWDAVEVTRGGRRVAVIPEAARLRRAMKLSLEEVEEILNDFAKIVKREPTIDETEFWKAVRDFKRSHKRS